jgi:hypothetical protein
VNLIDLIEHNLLPCSVKSLTGFDCPGCGLQRAFVALLRGDIVLSLQLNPALIPVMITLLFTAFHLRFQLKNGAGIIVFLFALSGSLMIVNFVVKLLCHQ